MYPEENQAPPAGRAAMLRGLSFALFLLSATFAVGGAGPGPRGGVRPADRSQGVAADTRIPGPQMASNLPFFYDLYTFRGTEGSTTVLAAFAVRAGRLDRERELDVRYRFDVTLVLADTALQSVSRTDDSVYVSVPTPLDGDHLIYTHVEVDAAPSATTLQRVIMTDATRPGHGQLYGSPYTIPDYSGPDLMLSDVALGRPDVEIGWRRGDVTLALLPNSMLPASAVDVYYEIYNLPLGNPYTTDISIRPIDEEGDERSGSTVRTRFADESRAQPSAAQVELRRIDASLEEGRYRLTVTVVDEITGRRASRSRLLRIREWRRGATMVPALPAARIAAKGKR